MCPCCALPQTQALSAFSARAAAVVTFSGPGFSILGERYNKFGCVSVWCRGESGCLKREMGFKLKRTFV